MLASLLIAVVAAQTAAPIATVSRGDWTITLDGSETANLAYQLDCMSGVVRSCSRAAFSSLWKKQLGWKPADDAALKSWRALHDRYAHSVTLDPASQDEPFPTVPRLLDLEVKLRVIFYQAPSRAALEHDLGLLVAPEDAATLLAAFDHFAPRFHGWYRRTASAQIDSFARRLAALLRDKGLIDYVGAVARFYGVPAGPHAMHIHLVAHPLAKSETNGEQLGGHAVVECLAGEAPEHRIDVVLHEAFHFMYRSAPATQAALQQAFLASKDPQALAAYGLLDEVLATTLGNALVPKRLSPARYAKLMADPRRLYDDPFIGPLAKQMVPVVERRLEKNQPLDARFAAQYLQAAHAALGEKLASPLLALRTMSLAWDGHALEPAADALVRAVSPRSMWRSSPLDDPRSVAQLAHHARLDGAVLVLDAQLADLDRWSSVLGAATLRELAARARREPAFVEPVARPAGATVWIFVAPDPAAMEKLVTGFTKL